jgi:serine/threonine protein kinase
MKPLAQNTLIQNRYLIVHLIGKGGMGEVYLAVDQRLGSAVALKRTFFAGDEMLSNAFEREARILARMRHPVLPKVSDHFSEGDEQYLVMEHISGDDLSKRLEAAQKPFPLSWVMFWADQLLDALSYLHSHEPPIIHRDIKPQNLKLTDENHVILLDFGLSKNSTGQTKIESGSSSGSTGSVVGYTPHYAPMEQIRGIGTSAKSDIYSLSATLYQLLTNKVPPDALSRADEMLNGQPDPIESPSSINPEIPEAVSTVVLKGMEVSQDKRFGSAREMQKAMRKSYAQMQEAMGAKTMIMGADGTSMSDSVPVAVPTMDKTEVMDFANPALSVPTALAGSSNASEAPTNLVSQPNQKPFDPNATIAFDPEPLESVPLNSQPMHSEPRQADVKTEVFLAGSNSLPTPPPSEPVEEVRNFDEVFDPKPVREDFGEAEPEFDPNATVPISAFDQVADIASAPSNETNYYTSDIGGQVEPPSGFESAAAINTNGQDSYTGQPSQAAYVKPAKAKKGSGGKVFAAVAAVVILFVLGAAALGGGYYYYTNYYNVAQEPEPSPSPLPSIEPSAEPTVDIASQTNTDTSNSSSSSNSNSSNSEVLTVAPTPSPQTEIETPSQQQQQGTTSRPQTQARNTPGTSRTPGTTPVTAKPTPKPTSTRDRKIILQ